MTKIGLIKEGKTPEDTRVALTPKQCAWIHQNISGIKILVEASPRRCFPDRAYQMAGIEVVNDISSCDILLGIKEVPVAQLIPGKTYLFFSHTHKKQEYNRKLLQTILVFFRIHIKNKNIIVSYCKQFLFFFAYT